MTTVLTFQTVRARRTAAYWAGVPAGSGFPTPKSNRPKTRTPAAAAPARLATPWGPPPSAWLYCMRLTACQAMADCKPENGAGNDSRTRPGGSPGATSRYQGGRVTCSMVKGRRPPKTVAIGTSAIAATATAPSAPRQSGAAACTLSRMIAKATAAARKPMAMKRCSIRFSITGILEKIQAGSNCPWRSPSEQATHTAKTNPKNHRRRSRQKTASPAARTARKLQPT